MGRKRQNPPQQMVFEFLDMITCKGTKPVAVQQYDDRGHVSIATILKQRISRHTPKGEKPLTQLLRHEEKNFEPTIYTPPPDSKFCGGCGEWVKRKGFSPDPRNKDGLQAHCKTCRNAHARHLYWHERHTAISALRFA